MAITDYNSLTAALPAWLDCATADISAVVSDLVTNAEKRIFREIRTPDMDSALSVNISAGIATIPTDLIELRYAYVDSNPVQYVQMVPPAQIYDNYPNRVSDGIPQVMARDGANWIFGPYPGADYVLRGTYVKTPTAIGASTNNALLPKFPDLYLYACLLETEPLLGRDPRMQIWESKYRLVKDLVNGEADRSRFSGNLSIRLGV
jgi:hypothetical protein